MLIVFHVSPGDSAQDLLYSGSIHFLRMGKVVEFSSDEIKFMFYSTMYVYWELLPFFPMYNYRSVLPTTC